MKNREALFPNRIKFTDEETGKQYVGTWDYADSPTEVGTKLTADVFLSNDNAAEYGIESEDPTPNEVFTVLSKHASRHASDGSDPIDPADIGAIPTSQKGAANGVATLNGNGKVTASQATSLVRRFTDSFTISADLNGCCILVSPETPITCTLPNLETLPDDFECEVVQQSVGTITFAIDSSVSDQRIYSLDDAVTTAGPYAVVSIKKILPTRWLLAGALA